MKKGVRAYSREEFVAQYTRWFYQGYFDNEIAEKLFLSAGYMSQLKRLYGVKTPRRKRNDYGVTEAHFQIAISNGLSRRIVLQRVQAGRSIEQAITLPKK